MNPDHESLDRLLTQLYPGAQLQGVERLTGGVSADVYRLDLKLADAQDLSVVLRSHRANHAGHSAELEFQLLDALHGGGVAVPRPLLTDASSRLLTNPFLVMAYVGGSSVIPLGAENQFIDRMAEALYAIHTLPTTNLPVLPKRNDPLPEVFDFLPQGDEWHGLRDCLAQLSATEYLAVPRLLHGDFWPENILWHDDEIVAVLDWEDAALGDPLSDVAACSVELRYKYGLPGMRRFIRAYGRHQALDRKRLALWHVYVSAAAQQFMGDWGLAREREAHMRREALASIREAGEILQGLA